MPHTHPDPDGYEYNFPAQVINIVDGDTFDVRIDLGFEVRTIERVRTLGIDTAETYGVDHDSEEYEQGVIHTNAFEEWVAATQENLDRDWPFALYSHEYERGAYGRVIGDLWSWWHQEWISHNLRENYDVGSE